MLTIGKTLKYTEAKQGRTFVIRLEDGDILHEEIEKFALEKEVNAGMLIAVGGVDSGSKLIVGPEDGRAEQINSMEHVLDNVSEIAGTGTIFKDDTGKPVLHMHIACGREDNTVTGCVRAGVKTWHILEIILIELKDCSAVRKLDETTGFKLMQP